MSGEVQDCAHEFVYAGLRFAYGANPLPGSGAVRRYYGHVYFCLKCCETRGRLVKEVEESSYSPVRFDAVPGSREEVGVPKYDREYGYR